ncbi:MAG TPA: glycosyltransferase family 4 protein [Vicinamibacterales bacterium]|jgi:Glycosyltransferase|nr:glycosyltransferase family 4 protein [Vicinamibacterales bacterium]
MRIAYLTADFGIPVLGTKGASAHVRGLVKALQEEGHEVFVLASNIGDDESGEHFLMRQVAFGSALTEVHDALQNEQICQGTRLAKDLRNILYGLSLEIQGRLLLEAFAPDFIYERHCLFTTAGRELARYFNIPLLLEVNAPLVLEQQKMRGLSLPLVARTAERLVLESSDHVFVVSQALRQYMTELGVSGEKVSVIPNAADPDLFGPLVEPSRIRHTLGWDDRFVIGFVGSMKPWHGVDVLLQAMRMLGGSNSPFRLLLVGSGPELDNLRARSAEMGLNDVVHMSGSIPHQQVPDYLRAMDVAVAPYAPDADEYFSPVKLFEYMAMALPVIAARLGQVSEVIEPERTGWLFRPGDAFELAGLIGRVASERELCRTVGLAARERVMNEYTWRHNARRVIAVAEDVIATRRPVASGVAHHVRATVGSGIRRNEITE